MMRYVVIFEDNPDMLAVRRTTEPAHLAFLEAHRDEILIAGGLRNEHGAAFVGGLWVLEVETKARAVELIESDPYFRPELRKYRVLAWGKALPQFQVTL
jgi:uncharacterized protein YciI